MANFTTTVEVTILVTVEVDTGPEPEIATTSVDARDLAPDLEDVGKIRVTRDADRDFNPFDAGSPQYFHYRRAAQDNGQTYGGRFADEPPFGRGPR